MRVEAFHGRSNPIATRKLGDVLARALLVLCAISYAVYLAHSEAVRSFVGTMSSASSTALRLMAG
ncbi:MAG: hypothetical protein ACREMQ_23910 [Longimicrobiales bacterium]